MLFFALAIHNLQPRRANDIFPLQWCGACLRFVSPFVVAVVAVALIVADLPRPFISHQYYCYYYNYFFYYYYFYYYEHEDRRPFRFSGLRSGLCALQGAFVCGVLCFAAPSSLRICMRACMHIAVILVCALVCALVRSFVRCCNTWRTPETNTRETRAPMNNDRSILFSLLLLRKSPLILVQLHTSYYCITTSYRSIPACCCQQQYDSTVGRGNVKIAAISHETEKHGRLGRRRGL